MTHAASSGSHGLIKRAARRLASGSEELMEKFVLQGRKIIAGGDRMLMSMMGPIEGVSRYGKAALVTMAFEPRFAVVLVGSSGEGGAKLHRRNFGEAVENLTGSGQYHWMAGNFMKYAGPLKWDDLPVDSHELIALVAPRPVFISSGEKGDEWVDARGMFMAAVAAGPVYKLLGKKD